MNLIPESPGNLPSNCTLTPFSLFRQQSWLMSVALALLLVMNVSCRDKKSNPISSAAKAESPEMVPGQMDGGPTWMNELQSGLKKIFSKKDTGDRLFEDQVLQELSQFLRGFPERTHTFQATVQSVTENHVTLVWNENIFDKRFATWLKPSTYSPSVFRFGAVTVPGFELYPSFTTTDKPDLWRHLTRGAKVNMAAKVHPQLRRGANKTFRGVDVGLVMQNFVLLPDGSQVKESDFKQGLPAPIGGYDPSDPLEMHAAHRGASMGSSRYVSFKSSAFTAGGYLAHFRRDAAAKLSSGNQGIASTSETDWEKACGLVKGYRISWVASVVYVSQSHALVAYPEFANPYNWDLYTRTDNVPFDSNVMKFMNFDSPLHMFDAVKWAEITGDKPQHTVHTGRINRPDRDVIPERFYECLRLSDYPWLKSYKRGDSVMFDATITQLAFGKHHALTSKNPGGALFDFVITFDTPRIYLIEGRGAVER